MTTSRQSTPTDAEQIESWRRNSKQEWSDAEKVAAWRKWGRGSHAGQQKVTAALLVEAGIGPGMRVLDVAGGGGDPSLAAARAVGTTGHIDVTDVSEGMLETARLFAQEDGLANITWQLSDAEELPFSGETFDRALCKCGVMFFADEQLALGEIRRVLKPGGRAAFLAWGPIEQIPLFTAVMDPLRRFLNPPPPPPGAPGPLKYSEAGSLAGALTKAGFRDVREQAVTSVFAFVGTPDELLRSVFDMAGLHGALGGLSSDQRTELEREALTTYGIHFDGQRVNLPLAYVLASGIQ